MNKILTVIIPTYNMEKYLRKCLMSLVLKDPDIRNLLEVLVINDGSKDASSAIGKEFQSQYPECFRVIDKDNGNYGSCVNRGLSEATGKYVKILDADDYFDTTAFLKYLEKLQTLDVDIVLNHVNIVDEQGNITANWSYPIKELEVVNYWDYINDFGWLNMHMVAYKTENIRAIGYKQTEGISYTDQEWIHLPITTVESAYSMPLKLYQYLVGREGQTMDGKVLSKKLGDTTKMLCSLGHTWQRYHGPEHKKKFLRDKFVNQTWRRYDEFARFNLYDDNAFRIFDNQMLMEFPMLRHEVDSITIKKLGISFPIIKLWRNHLRPIFTIVCKIEKIIT